MTSVVTKKGRPSKIHAILSLKGMTMRTLAEEVGMPHQRVRSLACGLDKAPKARKKIEAALGVSLWTEPKKSKARKMCRVESNALLAPQEPSRG